MRFYVTFLIWHICNRFRNIDIKVGQMRDQLDGVPAPWSGAKWSNCS